MDGNALSLSNLLTGDSEMAKRDITGHNRSEEAPRESEEKYRGLFEWMGEAVQICELIFDETGRAVDYIFLDVNPAYVQQSGGLQRSDVVGHRIKDILPLVEQAWIDRYADLVRTGNPIHFEEYSAALKKWFDVYASPMGGNRFSAVFSDITQRKRSEEALRESEIMLRTVLENSRDAISMIDLAKGKYVYMNEAQLTLMGFTAEEITCISAEETYNRIHPEDREIPLPHQKFIAAGQEEILEAEYRWKVKTGEYHYFNDRSKLVLDAKGKPAALVGIIRDVTEQKKNEERLSF